MAQSTTNIAKMKSVVTELDNIFRTMTENRKKLDELMSGLPSVWQGEGAVAYQNAYKANSQNIVLLGQAIQSCAATLTSITSSYTKADYDANEAILNNMIKG